MWFDPGYGYHVDATTGIATGNDPESIYAVMSGTHYNGGCCFDYGNSETNDRDDGCGTMEAIYFGNAHWHGNTGHGSTGPWVGADLEQGMYLSLIHISEPTRLLSISYAVFCLKKKKKNKEDDID
eukprot:TRINITY_DN675_c0_g1_i9.p2 TRINITY_DN675_c0_g1~~TRINITY_DN675_c0_g1_i9.p2  ORF type:complete len:125 (-),score=36.77 TRINITY_DN675_c0_g1_i9:80-454(-)